MEPYEKKKPERSRSISRDQEEEEDEEQVYPFRQAQGEEDDIDGMDLEVPVDETAEEKQIRLDLAIEMGHPEGSC